MVQDVSTVNPIDFFIFEKIDTTTLGYKLLTSALLVLFVDTMKTLLNILVTTEVSKLGKTETWSAALQKSVKIVVILYLVALLLRRHSKND